MMRNFRSIFPLMALALIACSNDGTKISTDDIPAIEIVATHAIETETPITHLTFVPNDIAAWLGRVILIDKDNAVFSTDIEGRNPDKTGTQKYSDVTGVNRSQSAGVFLAINKSNNNLEAFVESNDEGQFSPLAYSGSIGDPQIFCSSDRAGLDEAMLLSTGGNLLSLSLSVNDGDDAQISTLEQSIRSEIPAPSDTSICAASDTYIYAYAEKNSRLSIHDGSQWDHLDLGISIESMSALTLRDTPYLIMIAEDAILLFDVSNMTFTRKIEIVPGLSIAGLEKAQFVTATTSNFGGGAFSDGMIALVQKDQQRIVYISLSYFADVILGPAPI